MTAKVIGGGLLTGVVFYAISLIVWGVFKFLPVVPLSLAVPPQGLGSGWQIEHLVVSLIAGILWACGYAVYGLARGSGWLYGAIMFMVGILPAFVANFVIAAPVRSMLLYGALVSFIGALLGGRVLSFVVKK